MWTVAEVVKLHCELVDEHNALIDDYNALLEQHTALLAQNGCVCVEALDPVEVAPVMVAAALDGLPMFAEVAG